VADADNRIIPLVDDDQGEGVKDPLTLDDILQLQFDERLEEHRKDMFKMMIGNEFKKGQPEARWVPPKDFNKRGAR